MPPSERLVFFGTPEFAVPTLDALCAAGRRPLRVVTQPAKPVGRGRRLRQPPVAERALALELELAQPAKLSEPGFLERLREDRPAVAVVVAYGKIFRRRLLELPEHGCINLHASLLPAYRGAAPIQAAIAAGERRTGVTTMRMEAGLDSGPILLQRELEIGPDETAGELSRRLAEAGARLMVDTLDRLDRGRLVARTQDEAGVSWAPMLRKEDGRVEWELPAKRIYDRWRAFSPWPGASARLRGEPVKILACRLAAGNTAEPPGAVLGVRHGALEVACGGGTVLSLERLQRAGRRALEAAVFARGERLEPGDRFE